VNAPLGTTSELLQGNELLTALEIGATFPADSNNIIPIA